MSDALHRFESLRAELLCTTGQLQGIARMPVLDGSASGTSEPRLEEQVRAETRRVAASNMLHVHRFGEVVLWLEGLAVCPLKGIYLLDRVYEQALEVRAMGDLDLLVKAEDMEKIASRLLAKGFIEIEAAPHHRIFQGQGILLEIHTRLGFKHGVHSDWKALRPSPGHVHGRDVWVLDDSTTLVHLLTHFLRHTPFVGMKWVEDLLRWESMEWEAGAVEAVARRIGAWSSVLAALHALRSVLGPDLFAPIGSPCSRWLRRRLALHQRWIWPHLPDRPLDAEQYATTWRWNLSSVLLADRPGDAWATARAKAGELLRRK